MVEKKSRLKKFIAGNRTSIRKFLIHLVVFFVFNFIFFTLDVYTDSTKFFFHWPLAITFILFIWDSVRIFSHDKSSRKKKTEKPEKNKIIKKTKYDE